MVKPFHFARLPLIIFGTGKVSELPKLVSDFGKSVLLVTGARSFVASPAAVTCWNRWRAVGSPSTG